MAAPVGLVEVCEVRVDRLDPAPGDAQISSGNVVKPTGTETGEVPGPATAAASARRPSYDRAADASVPVSQYSVMLSTILPVSCPRARRRRTRGTSCSSCPVVVEHPGRQPDGESAGRTRSSAAASPLEEVAEAVLLERRDPPTSRCTYLFGFLEQLIADCERRRPAAAGGGRDQKPSTAWRLPSGP